MLSRMLGSFMHLEGQLQQTSDSPWLSFNHLPSGPAGVASQNYL